MREARRYWLAVAAAGLVFFHSHPVAAIDAYVNGPNAQPTLTTGYDASATTVVVGAGEGAKLAAAPFNCTWFNFTDYPGVDNDPNYEIVRVTAKSTDTLTIVRAQEGTTAHTHNNVGKVYKFVCTITKKFTGDVATEFTTPRTAVTGGTGQSGYAVGDQLVADTTTSLSKVSDGRHHPHGRAGASIVRASHPGNLFRCTSAAATCHRWRVRDSTTRPGRVCVLRRANEAVPLPAITLECVAPTGAQHQGDRDRNYRHRSNARQGRMTA
jgi:hypothetical protein